jgi:plasmid stability protein
MKLTKRTNLLLTPEQDRAIEERAAATGKSKGAIIRELVDKALLGGASPTALEAARRLVSLGLPVADWQQMETEIEEGREG